MFNNILIGNNCLKLNLNDVNFKSLLSLTLLIYQRIWIALNGVAKLMNLGHLHKLEHSQSSVTAPTIAVVVL